jgi:phosphate transport system permease protein
VSALSRPPSLTPAAKARRARARLNRTDRRANRALKWITLGGGFVVFGVMLLVAVRVILSAETAFNKYGLSFIGHTRWIPSLNLFGAWPFLYGTLVTSAMALIFSTILGVAIGLFLAILCPRWLAGILGPMVELLAAVPSVVLGLLGIVLLSPVIGGTIEPAIHSVLGFIPLFGTVPPTDSSLFTASLVLTIMVVPIISALTRDLFLTVPEELTDGAAALGATTWEVIRGVVLPTTTSGIIATCVLGFGRAIGEAIAVAQVVGSVIAAPLNQFAGGYTGAAFLANTVPSATGHLEVSALYYIAAILMVLSLITNLLARQIAQGRFGGGNFGGTITTMADEILGWRGRRTAATIEAAQPIAPTPEDTIASPTDVVVEDAE